MNEQEAFKVCDVVEAYFNFKLSEQQFKLWVDLLVERGDYKETMKKVKNRAMSDIPYKPMINEIIARPYQQNIDTNKTYRTMDEETRKKLEQYIKESEAKAKEGKLTIHDL